MMTIGFKIVRVKTKAKGTIPVATSTLALH